MKNNAYCYCIIKIDSITKNVISIFFAHWHFYFRSFVLPTICCVRLHALYTFVPQFRSPLCEKQQCYGAFLSHLLWFVFVSFVNNGNVLALHGWHLSNPCWPIRPHLNAFFVGFYCVCGLFLQNSYGKLVVVLFEQKLKSVGLQEKQITNKNPN